MQYLLLCCFDEKLWEDLPEAQRDKIMDDYQALQQDLVKSGHYLAGAKLGSTSAATTVHWKNDKPTMTDGPFAETKEQVGGFFIIEARDLNDAIRVASKHPAAHLGESVGWGIEVRPIEAFVLA